MLYIDPLSSPFVNVPRINFSEPIKEQAAFQELEHYFLYMLLQEMRKSMTSAVAPSQSREAAFFNDLLDDALSGAMAQSGQLGLAAQLAAQLHAAEQQSQLQPTNIPNP